MTIEEAFGWLDTARLVLINQCRKDAVDSYVEAFGLAIAALRAQREAEKNEPLTKVRLLQMDGQPVWWWNTSSSPVCTLCSVDRFSKTPLFISFDWFSDNATNITPYEDIKRRGYKPYRHPPVGKACTP